MPKFYVEADLCRNASAKETVEIGVSGAKVFVGRAYAVIDAPDGLTALALGEECIQGNLKKGVAADTFGWLPAADIDDDDRAVYKRYVRCTWARYYRICAGLTQTEAAQKTGVGLRHIQKLEDGEIPADSLTLRNARALAAALGVTVEELTDGPRKA